MRMLIGTSLGGCLQSIMKGEVSEGEVLMIITRTMAPDLDRLLNVVVTYHKQGNFGASLPDRYEMTDFRLDDLQELTARLYLEGKIHQPRNYGVSHGGYIHRNLAATSGVWVEVSPLGTNQNPLVVDAYEKYKILDALTK